MAVANGCWKSFPMVRRREKKKALQIFKAQSSPTEKQRLKKMDKMHCCVW